MKGRIVKSMIIVMISALVVTMLPLTAAAASKAPGKTKITSIKVGTVSKKKCTATVTVKWKKVKNATGYQVYGRRYHEDWVKIKTVGKNTTKLKIKGVYSGDFDIRVRAIRKKGGKTYKGKFSTKHKFIKCPITLQQYVKRIDPMKEHLDQGIVYDTYYKGNTQFNVISLEKWGSNDFANLSVEEVVIPETKAMFHDVLTKDLMATNTVRVDFLIGKTGIKSAKVVAIVQFKGVEVTRHTYTGVKKH